MFTGWINSLLAGIQAFNEILTAGIAITAFSLLIYALTFNLRDRVARSFAIILLSVVVVFTSDAVQSAVQRRDLIDLFLRLQWIGIVFLPPAYLHLSDALLVTAGRPSRGRRRWVVRGMYVVSAAFLVLLALGQLVGPLLQNAQPANYLQRTTWTEIFTFYYLVVMVVAGVNLLRAYRRMLTRFGRRRMIYLMAGATAPAIGCYPFLLFGSSVAAQFPLVFWLVATSINVLVGVLIILMAYAVAFFGVSWPDRLVKSRLFKWIMRGPATASLALFVLALVRRAGEPFGQEYTILVPFSVVTTVLLMEHLITIVAPWWERRLFFGGDQSELALLQNVEERLLTQSDLRQFLEIVLAAVRDHMQSPSAFVAALDGSELSLLLTAGRPFSERANLSEALQTIRDEKGHNEFIWNDYWILPLRQRRTSELDLDMNPPLLGLLGVARQSDQHLEQDQRHALWLLAERAALALDDRQLQQRVFRSLEDLEPQVDSVQRMRANSRYGSIDNLLSPELPFESGEIGIGDWVRDALNHYWGGPKLTQSPLIGLHIVQETAKEFDGNTANALRSVLKKAVDQIRPEGERRFTSEWILYNILDLKFIEGRKVREVAGRLSMSEADLYRKQRVAVEAVAKAILEMENQIGT
ncbi:MAG: histidine kinase N-terminal 7TM domain-containing protein [Anaerolineales bacterium]